jgi:hypothetical protein
LYVCNCGVCIQPAGRCRRCLLVTCLVWLVLPTGGARIVTEASANCAFSRSQGNWSGITLRLLVCVAHTHIIPDFMATKLSSARGGRP